MSLLNTLYALPLWLSGGRVGSMIQKVTWLFHGRNFYDDGG